MCGIRLNPALVLRCLQSPAVSHQAPREGPLGSKPRVRIRPQEHGRPNLQALRRAEQQAKVRAQERGSVGPMVEAQWAIKVAGGSGGTAHSPALNDRHPEGPGCQQGGRLSPALGSGVPNPSTVAPEPWGVAHRQGT